jgi:XTP/dITP diphosphohydrolase
MMNKLLIATTNPGKLDEIRSALTDVPIELVSLSDVGIKEYAEETGSTFEENAVIKATFYARVSGLPTLADDGGFEIDALGGAPGVKSHRWIHGEKDNEDEDLIAYTFKQMKHVPEGKRGAQLRLVLALALPDGTIHTTEEYIRGIIPDVPSMKRTKGFPYRSILFLPKLGKYYDHHELTTGENAAYNHRKKAVEKLKPYIWKLC